MTHIFRRTVRTSERVKLNLLRANISKTALLITTKGHRSLSIFDDGGGVPDSPIRDVVMLCWLQGFLVV